MNTDILIYIHKQINCQTDRYGVREIYTLKRLTDRLTYKRQIGIYADIQITRQMDRQVDRRMDIYIQMLRQRDRETGS